MTLLDDSAAAPAPSAPPSVPRVAVFGLGRVGLAQACALARRDGVMLAGLADSRGAYRRFASGSGFAPVFASAAALFDAVSPDAVFVCAPAPLRATLAREALARRAWVLVVSSVLESEVVRDGAGRLCAGPALAWLPPFARLRTAAAAGAFGALREVHASAFASRVFGPRAAPGDRDVLDHLASDLLHLVDAAFGAPMAVSATGHRLYGEALDEAHLELKLPSEVVVRLDVSWSVPGYPRAATVIEVSGERGRMLASDDALEAELEAPVAGFDVGLTRVSASELEGAARFDAGGEDIWALAGAFLERVRGVTAPAGDPLAPARAARVAATLAAARRSARTGGASTDVRA